MNLQDAIRKVRLLGNVKEGRGFTRAEVHSARQLSQRLIEQFSIQSEPTVIVRSQRRPSWDSWEQVAGEFRLRLRRFGKRASISIIEGKHLVSIKGDDEEWTAQQVSAGGWETVSRGTGVRTLHAYLSEHVRGYSFFRTRG
jgi:hypothetical protein